MIVVLDMIIVISYGIEGNCDIVIVEDIINFLLDIIFIFEIICWLEDVGVEL